MAAAASTFLVLSLWLAVIVGPQMRMWPWGPALLALAAALGCGAIAAIGNKRPILGPGTLILGLAVTGWFAWRAWTSPVAELAHADLLLLASAVGAFLVCRLTAHDARAEAIFLWGLAALLAASLVMIVGQLGDRDFSQFRWRATLSPSGFYAQYNEGANFLIGAGFLLMGGALFGKQHKAIKILWLLIATAGIAAVWFTRSRGAVFGVIVGFVALAAFILAIGAKRKARWFAPAMIAFPIILLASGFALYFGWESVQRIRSDGKQGVAEMMDNTSRLRNYSLAFDATMLNPAAGGGSRSYSWNSLHVWNPQEHGLASHLPEQVHNEILQAATDYGVIGAGGVLALIGWLSLRGLWRCKFDDVKLAEHPVSADALRLGGMAALAGMLVQSSFSFVFHLLPGAMLLGIALARLSEPSAPAHGGGGPGVLPGALRIITVLLATLLAVAIVPAGIVGTRALAALMPVYYKTGSEPEEDDRLARFTQAIEAWPQSDLHVSRAKIHHRRAIEGSEVIDPVSLELALSDYLAAARFNPKFPAHFVNMANLHSLSGEIEAAEARYDEAIRLQGNMEPAFRAHFHQAEHFRRKGIQRYRQGDHIASIQAMEAALESFNAAEVKSAWLTNDTRLQRNAIYLGLAHAQEAAGDYRGARSTLEDALNLRGDHAMHYHIGMLQYRNAMRAWHQRQPEEALKLFQNARHQLLGARNHPPQGISRAGIQEQIDTIEENLKLLREAGIRSE